MIVLDKLKPLSFTFRSCYECSLKSDNKMCSPGLYSKQKYFQCDKIGYQFLLASTCSGAFLEQVSPLVTTLWKLQKLEYAVYNILYILYTSVFHKNTFLKKKQGHTLTCPCGAYITQIRKLFSFGQV